MESRIKELAVYRCERAEEELANAKMIFSNGMYKLALNRAYYAVFHGIRAVNALDAFDSSKHSGIIAHFNQYHVKNGDFPKEVSRIIKNTSEMREHADYDDFFTTSKEEAQDQIANAERFIGYVKVFIRAQTLEQ